MKRGLSFAVGTLVIQALGSANAAVTVAEHTLPPTATSWFEVAAGIVTEASRVDNRQAQTFVPTKSGYLAEVAFNSHRTSTTGVDLRVSVASVIGGQPNTILESVLLPFSLVNSSSLAYHFLVSGAFSQSVAMSGTLQLDAGVTCALVFSTDTNEANYSLYGDFSGYDQGDILQFQNSGPYQKVAAADLLFRVTANQTLSPLLTLTRSGNQITLSWTQSGFVLQENSTVIDAAGWSNVVGASSPVTVTISPGVNKFYRLRQP